VTYEYEANGRLLEHNPEKRFTAKNFATTPLATA
ncbi:hypothetical protein PSYPI_40119, partial [Pseudomonas syringae pv. pisi str. 1704B]